jgi:antigen flippase
MTDIAARVLKVGEGSTYRQILRSSAWVGGSSLVVMAAGLLRTKAMAVLLGSAGFGVMGLLLTLVDLSRSVAGMGINASGVRQIAQAAETGDARCIGRTVGALRRTAWVLGGLGALALVALAVPVSELTFGSRDYAPSVALLSLALLLRLVSDAQGALLQGMRRIADLAKAGTLGALGGAAVSIPIVAALGERGIAPSIVAAALAGLAATWWYSRRPKVEPVAMSLPQLSGEVAALLKLGVAFMASGLLVVASAYVVRLILVDRLGLQAAGLYHAAWTIAGLYIGVLLQSMAADFYPRLVGVADRHAECNRLVNEQALVGMLLATPGVLATLVFADLAIVVLYSGDFAAAAPLLRWTCLGMALRTLTWPLGFIIVAKGRRALFLGSEMAWTVVSIALAWAFIAAYGLEGAGMAFFASYVFHGLMIYPIVRRLSGFRWSVANLKAGACLLPTVGAVLMAFLWLPPAAALAIGVAATLASGLYALHRLDELVPADGEPHILRRVLRRVLRRRP